MSCEWMGGSCHASGWDGVCLSVCGMGGSTEPLSVLLIFWQDGVGRGCGGEWDHVVCQPMHCPGTGPPLLIQLHHQLRNLHHVPGIVHGGLGTWSGSVCWESQWLMLQDVYRSPLVVVIAVCWLILTGSIRCTERGTPLSVFYPAQDRLASACGCALDKDLLVRWHRIRVTTMSLLYSGKRRLQSDPSPFQDSRGADGLLEGVGQSPVCLNAMPRHTGIIGVRRPPGSPLWKDPATDHEACSTSSPCGPVRVRDMNNSVEGHVSAMDPVLNGRNLRSGPGLNEWIGIHRMMVCVTVVGVILRFLGPLMILRYYQCPLGSEATSDGIFVVAEPGPHPMRCPFPHRSDRVMFWLLTFVGSGLWCALWIIRLPPWRARLDTPVTDRYLMASMLVLSELGSTLMRLEDTSVGDACLFVGPCCAVLSMLCMTVYLLCISHHT
jgi:hypothetical protein